MSQREQMNERICSKQKLLEMTNTLKFIFLMASIQPTPEINENSYQESLGEDEIVDVETMEKLEDKVTYKENNLAVPALNECCVRSTVDDGYDCTFTDRKYTKRKCCSPESTNAECCLQLETRKKHTATFKEDSVYEPYRKKACPQTSHGEYYPFPLREYCCDNYMELEKDYKHLRKGRFSAFHVVKPKEGKERNCGMDTGMSDFYNWYRKPRENCSEQIGECMEGKLCLCGRKSKACNESCVYCVQEVNGESCKMVPKHENEAANTTASGLIKRETRISTSSSMSGDDAENVKKTKSKEASKHYREKRKNAIKEVFNKEKELSQQNKQLQEQIKDMEQRSKTMQELFASKINTKNQIKEEVCKLIKKSKEKDFSDISDEVSVLQKVLQHVANNNATSVGYVERAILEIWTEIFNTKLNINENISA